MLRDKVAVITGASRGLGFEMSKEFAERGATVIICSRSKASAENSASLIKGTTYAEELDVTNPQGVREFVRRVAARHKHIDILINNAGYPFDRVIWNKRFHEVAEEDLGRIIDVDLKGTFRLSQAAIPLMLENDSAARRAGGVIINIASTPAVAGHTAGAPYSIAKSGVIAITKHIALEYGDKNIRAYTLALGNISTEATFASMTLTERKKAAMENSMKRWGDPREVATIAAAVAVEDFSFATGNTIVIDGGTVML
ncbi:MAG TPA: SDR family oxidoreductase [Nitrososphaera sp.]|jgi:NAD(P)-dependent dehydrogenase (short-subunit alcohol dehydrogenase family)|nr:SDR family oxidoreductase [Nitrososphaera sp.]